MEDNCCQEDHIVHVDIPVVRLQALEAVEGSLEMEGDSNLMREVDHMEMEGIRDLERIHNLDLEEVVRNHAGVGHNNLVGVAALLEVVADEAHQVVLVVVHGLELEAEFLAERLEGERHQEDADVKEVHYVDVVDGEQVHLDLEEYVLEAAQDLLVLAGASQEGVDGVQLVVRFQRGEKAQMAVQPEQRYEGMGQNLEDLVRRRNVRS